MEKYCRAEQATGDSMARVCCMLDTASEYVIIIAFPLQQSLHEHTSLLHYMYIGCLVSPDFTASHYFQWSLVLCVSK